MSKEVKNNLLRYGIGAAIAIVMVVAYVCSENIAGQTQVNVYRIMSDAFSLPGLLFLFSGTMVWLANQGALDAIGYMVTAVVRFLIPGGHLKHEKYGDYVARQREKEITGYGFLFIIALVCLAVAGVFLWLYFNLHGPI